MSRAEVCAKAESSARSRVDDPRVGKQANGKVEVSLKGR
jgi:hypothetical protein